MQIFLDSANVDEIKEINELGIITGVTTNPTLMAKSSTNFLDSVLKICNIIKQNVSIEIVASDYKSMIIQGNQLLKINKDIVIKLPTTWEGIKACKYFAAQGNKVNMTLCFTVNQALLASLAGASYISPFVGRLDDTGECGINLVKDIRQIFNNYTKTINTKILAASIRNINHVRLCALSGADVVTLSAGIIKKLIDHPLTLLGLDQFEKSWQESRLSI